MEFLILFILVGAIIYLLLPSKKRKLKDNFEITDEIQLILNILNNSNESIFITGKAGTGKSSVLRYFRNHTNKKHVLLAPTGIAALNVGGQTVHSFFKFPPRIIKSEDILPDYVRADLFKNLDMVIIDEVSMVRSDLMHGIDVALRKNRNRLNEPFGGVQMVFVGDLFQLPPVVTEKDREAIMNQYGGEYFFDAPVFRTFNFHFNELNKIFRQSAEQIEFKSLLNNIRHNSVTFDDMVLLNSRHRANAGVQENSVFLTTRKIIARNLNSEELEKINSPEITFTAKASGKYEKYFGLDEEKMDDNFPAPYKLKLKLGAQIMMLKNDPGLRWANGSVGKVNKLTEDSIWVQIGSNEFKVEKETWKEVEYALNPKTKEIESWTTAEFVQYPLQLAFAMTIHKCQGKTFDKITIDVGRGAFAHGQTYVAVSRCKTLEGIILNNPINNQDIIVDPRVIDFYSSRKVPAQRFTQAPTGESIGDKLLRIIAANRNAIIDYANFDGEISRRELSNIQISNDFTAHGYTNAHIKAYCHLRNEERSFKINRIISIEEK